MKIYELNELSEKDIFLRNNSLEDVFSVVKEILDRVKKEGDTALRFYSKKFDGFEKDDFVVDEKEIEEAFEKVETKFVDIIGEAKTNIENYHLRQRREGFVVEGKTGLVLGQMVVPIDSVGVYVPGGTASYPSTVLMNVIPAKIAGVKKIVMVTPPNRDGSINPYTLVAARLVGVNKILKLGGASAIAALAYGTDSIERVDKIVGPGNAYVSAAKKLVYGDVGIDMIAGPSEILIIADETARASFVAADLLSQAEHDKNATAVLITTSKKLAEAVSKEVEEQLEKLERKEIASFSIKENGKIIITQSIEKAIEVSNRIAPEHLEICVEKAFSYLDRIKNAGSIFLGNYTPEPMGDYFSGTNHTLPTQGTARFSNALGVDDFVKRIQYSAYTEDALKRDCEKVAFFARKEGLSAHARAVELRFE